MSHLAKLPNDVSKIISNMVNIKVYVLYLNYNKEMLCEGHEGNQQFDPGASQESH
jgi:hypothetical protein